MMPPLIKPGPYWMIPVRSLPKVRKNRIVRIRDTIRAVLKERTLVLSNLFREPYSSNFDSKRATMASRAACSSSPSTEMRSSVL